MSVQEMVIEEIKTQPEPVLREVWHYLKFLEQQRQQEAWSDILPTREVEQKVLASLMAMRPRREVWLVDMGIVTKTRPAADLKNVKTALKKACAL